MYRPTSVSANIITENCLTFCTKEAQTQKTALSAKKGQKGASLDKLEKRTDKTPKSHSTSTPDKYQKFAMCKFFTGHYASRLLLVSAPDSRMRPQYSRVLRCAEVVQVHDGETRTFYCKSKVCTICARIRTAKLIEKYLPVMQRWRDAYMLVLTIRNVPASDLRQAISDMCKVISKFGNKQLKQHQRNGGKLFKCIRTIEVTYSNKRDDYHPHLNVIVPDSETAQALHDYWLQNFSSRASYKGQFCSNISSAKDSVSTLKEIFKYISKHTSEAENGKQKSTYVNAQDIIYEATHGLHCVRTLGLTAEDMQPIEDQPQAISDSDSDIETTKAPKGTSDGVYHYYAQHGNWFDKHTGEAYINSETITEKDKNTVNALRYKRWRATNN
jgi:hypothetical protein